MMHWSPGRLALADVTPIGAMTDPVRPLPAARSCARADHARMLAHAAKRRRAASGEDRAYWKACAPAAVARAASLRAGGLPRLP